jgi:DNA-binding NtrC family response regulator
MSAAPPAPIPSLPVESAPSAEEPSIPKAPAPPGEFLPVAYAGPFKACKDELVRAFEREYLTRLLSHTRGNIARAAREAELDRKHLYSLLHKYGLVRSEAD